MTDEVILARRYDMYDVVFCNGQYCVMNIKTQGTQMRTKSLRKAWQMSRVLNKQYHDSLLV
jgi:hypothetical protein